MLLATLVMAAVVVSLGWRTVRAAARRRTRQPDLRRQTRWTAATAEAARGLWARAGGPRSRQRARAALRGRDDGDAGGLSPPHRPIARRERGEGTVLRTERGERAVAFTHAIDCRDGAPVPSSRLLERARGQPLPRYWFYCPGSATGATHRARSARSARPRTSVLHRDDWSRSRSGSSRRPPLSRASSTTDTNRAGPGQGPDLRRGRPRRPGSRAGRRARHQGRPARADPLSAIARTDRTPSG